MSSQEAGGRLAWFWNRLCCMTPAEVAHRALYAWQSKAERVLGLGVLSAEPVRQLGGGAQWVRASPAPSSVDAAAYLAEAAAIERGSVRLFASQRYEVGSPPQWNRCPLTGVQAPALAAHAIAITDRAQVGDIKYLWELNRHLHWVALAQAWALSGDTTHLRALGEQLRSWLDQCAFGIGPNWTSSLEYALRLLNWSAVWQLIGGLTSPLFDGAQGMDLRQRWLASINLHARAISKHFSRHSSANNHLVGELAGIFVAAQTWPFWASFEILAEQARRELEREVQLQVTADGVLREQAFEYATFTFDFFLAAERAAAAAGRPMSPAYLARMKAMCEFVAAVTTVKGEVPQVGDADGAEAFRLDPRSGRDCFAAMLQKGAALFAMPEWLPLKHKLRDDVAWLDMAGANLAQPGKLAGAALRQLDFPEGGYFLFGRNLGGPDEVLGLVDAGPLGYLGIAAHGHADALQVWLSVAGLPVLIDPGTYSYWADKWWRDYFRGTAAHNTVRVAGLDQSVSGGRFMWTRKAQIGADRSVQRSADGGFHLRASHDGYRRLPGRFCHTREVKFDKIGEESKLLVIDEVRGSSAELIELFWHVAPDWTVEPAGEDQLSLRHKIKGLCIGLRINASLAGRLEVITAQDAPPLAWWSKDYGEKKPCHTIRWAGQGSELRIETQFSLPRNL
ncbi:heparinase II/III family protein [Paucibacter sp. B2R-40]|uniref:heparinase II/III family protein n=1 Tax=Paucibacter sp. B2R-40 TaxID=2893554 RepID=UPI0021E4549E|nr:alginate lyase family protein [Paucibacter sp. B2R-40]MCV2357166.1 heparinase II/III family protein [Paucibacter sp. B2R-40]